MADGAAVGGTCVAVNVASVAPVDVAANLASRHGVTLAGVGEGSGTDVLPDVWVPDSTSWLLRLRTAGATGFAPTNNASIARSPVVVAAPEPVANQLGWPGKKLGWADLLRQMTTGTKLHTGIVDPTRDASGLSGLLALGAAAGSAGGDTQSATTAALRALATGRSAVRDDLLARFPRSVDPASIASALSAAPLSEQDVIDYNAKKPPIELAALYLDPAPMSLDYPYSVMPGAEPAKVSAAQGLFDVLNTSGFHDRLAGQGLRASNGTWGRGFEAPDGAPSTDAAPASAAGGGAGEVDPATVDRALSTWTAVTLPARMLAVIDVSGSMKEPVATAHNATREQVTVAAATQGLGLFDDSWAVGLWTFSTRLVGGLDYRQLVPIGPLSSQRGNMQRALAGIVPKENGDTGLYDTILAAYKTVQGGWEPGRINSVVMLTDGKNEDDNGISEAQLLADLKGVADPDRPIQVVIIGIGDSVDRGELEGITKITGGGVFVTEDPAKIGDIFLKAISLRPTAAR